MKRCKYCKKELIYSDFDNVTMVMNAFVPLEPICKECREKRKAKSLSKLTSYL